jgi:S1-C subfamily serine protease
MKKLFVYFLVLAMSLNVSYSQYDNFEMMRMLITIGEARNRQANINLEKINSLIQYIFELKSQIRENFFLDVMDRYYNELKVLSEGSLYDHATSTSIQNIQYNIMEEVDKYNQRLEQSIAQEKERNQKRAKTGTGFALSSNGYIITNYHVINNAELIYVKGVKGDFSKKLRAQIVALDKNNDLAIIEVISGLGSIPYTFKQSTVNVGEDIFVLGYPMTDLMGEEIKLTNGIVSSKTGFQGDISSYQISAPIQPGNSGAHYLIRKGKY